MEETKNNFKLKDWHVILISFLVSFLFLIICSNNSFLYSFNDNQDVNWYITMGNGLLNGKIPYKDLYEQKGPIVYFVFSLLCMFNNPYILVFLLEIVCSTLFLYFSYKIILLVLGKRNIVFSIILTAFLTFTSAYFVVGGGAVEEYCLPIFSYMLYCFLEYINKDKNFNFYRCLIWGILIGILLFVKFTLLIFPFIIFVFFMVSYIREKKYKELLKMILMFSIGVVLVTVPIALYFIKNKALTDFLTAYLYNNIFLYSGDNNIFYNFAVICFICVLPTAFTIFGIIKYRFMQKNEKYKNLYLILFVTYALLLIISGNFAYYFLPLVVFVPLGCSAFLDYISIRYQNIINTKIKTIGSIFLLICSLIVGNGTIELTHKKSDYIQYQVAKDIRLLNNENPTLFCYKMWDYGFYNVLGVVPNVKYYANNAFEEDSFPEMYQEFKNYIEKKKTEFLIVDSEVYEEEKTFIDQSYKYYKEYSYKYHKDNYRSMKMSVILLIRK